MGDVPASVPARRGLDGFMLQLRRDIPGKLPGLSIVLVVLLAGFSIVVPGFLSVGTFQSMMFQLPQLGLLAMAMALPMISGGLNLAIIATANACGLIMVVVMRALIPAAASGSTVAFGLVAALAAGLAAGIAIGGATGLLIARTGVHPILITLGVQSIVEGVSVLLTHGKVVSGLPSIYGKIGNSVVMGVPVTFLALAVVAIVVGIVLKRTSFGIALAMTGSNPEATQYSSVDVKRVLVKVYALSGILCFLAACLMLARFNSASSAYAKSYLLVTVLAAVLGGVDPFGGFGKISGIMLALGVLQVISSGCNLLGFSDYLTLGIWGLTLIAVMSVQGVSRR
ncbi:ABC transporter permease [Lichenicola cladoniae]|uniref:ABC transporter permease n=1 Tax=Lichenicola cladoniae TaxID=1484109 RepID=A0A6M8HLC7_9PROT|nr:ABC transporter permease [Lichenicola cladoniae]NPD68904.1 ABC transporter permease [Acetobacteraceae bacterium]QKE89148.1 ABC transporter permease [Lichenicola cladoniae]